MAERIKSEGKTLNELVAKKAKALFGPQANFNSLSEVQKNRYIQVSLNPQASLTHK
jgi:SHS2 domain-containing protein